MSDVTESSGTGFSRRQSDIMRLLAKGHGVDVIAASLLISPMIVRREIGRIRRLMQLYGAQAFACTAPPDPSSSVRSRGAVRRGPDDCAS